MTNVMVTGKLLGPCLVAFGMLSADEKVSTSLADAGWSMHHSVSIGERVQSSALSKQNLDRAIAIADAAFLHYFTGTDMAMARFYNPQTGVRSDEKGSVWMYTAAIESVNAILHALKTQKEHGASELYSMHFDRYAQQLVKLYDNLAYYEGTFDLTSFTQTRSWSVYGVHRASRKGAAKVAGIENVYDDQQWLVRELMHSYRLTEDLRYLEKAEYLADYVLDGWDTTLDPDGNEHGGIPWGPGYVSKHACSNSPFISSLVWLSEHYANSDEVISRRYIAENGHRLTREMKKTDYYLDYAEAVYQWQKGNLLRKDGVFDDFLGGCVNGCAIVYEDVDGVRYRSNTGLRDVVGPAYSYNTGVMLSGAVDLYRATEEGRYLEDVKELSDASFRYFAKPSAELSGHDVYAVSGFNNWFNGVLMRAYVEAQPLHHPTSRYIAGFQKNLNYGYENFNQNGLLPTDLLAGWDEGDKGVEGMFQFAFAAEYALLAEYELRQGN